MRDRVSIERAEKLHPSVRDEVINTISDIEETLPETVFIRIVQGLRTIEEQNELYAQGRTKPGAIVTKAPGGKSYHNYGLAFDFCLLYAGKISWVVNQDWMKVVNAFKAKGWVWGGTFKTIKDYPHLEKSFGYSVSKLLAIYKPGEYVKL